jgi:hypothetical protein
MARIVRRRRLRDGTSLGEQIVERLVITLLLAALAYGAYWYFTEYRRSPQVALGAFLGAVKAGNVERQYSLLAESTKRVFPTRATYDQQSPLAHGLTARIQSFTIGKPKESPNRWEADVTLSIRKTGQALYQAGSDQFTDHYVLKREADEWKVVLEECRLNSLQVASKQ